MAYLYQGEKNNSIISQPVDTQAFFSIFSFNIFIRKINKEVTKRNTPHSSTAASLTILGGLYHWVDWPEEKQTLSLYTDHIYY